MKTIRDRVSEILHEALRGYDQSERYRTEDGFVRWGLVEKDIIAAIDEAAAPPTAIDWEPIETAPKDGTVVLVYYEKGLAPVVHIAWYNSPEEWEIRGKYSGWPTCEEWKGWRSCPRGGISVRKNWAGGEKELDGDCSPTHWAPYNGPQEGGR